MKTVYASCGNNERSEGKTKNVGWDSELVIFKPVIILSRDVIPIVASIQNEMKGYEFSVLFKGYWHEKGVFYVGSEYYIPNQEVDIAEVDYLENISLKRQEGYNVIAHSHPFDQDTDFSCADDETINSHFPCSVLSNGKGRIIRGNLLIRMSDNNNMSIPVGKEDITENIISIDISGLEKIGKKPKRKRKENSIYG